MDGDLILPGADLPAAPGPWPAMSPGGPVAVVPTLVAAAGERARHRFLEFFAANIRNPNTRVAYYTRPTNW